MPRILLIDSYDSFTNNLAALCRLAIPNACVHIIKNDSVSFDEIRPFLACFSAVIVGPGPGSPLVDKDVGVIKSLFHLPDSETLPIFGVCLGLQSMAVEHGAAIHRLHVVKHGQISPLMHSGQDLFLNIDDIQVTRYHSLHVRFEGIDNLQELAHVDDGSENGRVIMAIRHKTNPFWAVQYHPESIKTSRGLEVMANFWRLAVEWSTRQGRDVVSWSPAAEKIFGSQWPTFQEKPSDHTPKTVNTVVYRRVVAHTMSVTEICEAMDLEESSSPFVLLESVADPGRFSIIGVLHADSPRFTHYAGDRCVNVFHGQAHLQEDLGEHNVWSWAASYMRARRFTGGNPSIPFWGGLVGYISYEMGVSGLGIARPTPSSGIHHGNPNHKHHPDVNLVYVERSIVHDKQNGFLYVQSLLPSDRWICDTVALLGNDNISIRSLKLMRSPCPVKAERPMAKLPSKDQYISRIRRCQEYLATGESYELCLTARTHVTLSPSSSFNSSWELYKSARRHNPAPYSAYLSLHPSTIISTSPERFLSFSRSPNVRCQLRPIKGTVRKTHVVDRMVAEQLLAGSKKEVAENLMIVDLIRHDLHGIVGPDVEVTQFCGIEEYETVWQMVSVIEGQLNQPNPGDEDELGWEVLRSSLPPGSMTGAPKKRSVEILNTLEDDQRGIYSGVLGYWDVGGGGDWAVTIRTCVHHADDPRSGTDGTTWTIGAGGAITALSDPEAEWEEMLLKLQGVLNAFRDP